MARTLKNPNKNKTAARKKGGISLNKGKGSNAGRGDTVSNTSNEPIAKT